ncbi:hypothetical protein [Streptomyces wedmorensis]
MYQLAGCGLFSGLITTPKRQAWLARLFSVGFSCVDAGPDQSHVVPPCGVVLLPATDDLAVDSLLSDHSQFLIGSRVVVGHRAANQ